MSFNPFEEAGKIAREIERLLTGLLKELSKIGEGGLEQGYRRPLTDIRETENEIIVTSELPGVEKEDITLNVTENSVEIKAEIKREREGECKLEEREGKYFYRLCPLPGKVDPNGAEASYKNGILEIKLPKVEGEKKVKVKVE
ncbi:TPA: Hsp20/alpha crystallin family protein [Candidatus Bathyarchaeota archaeon]|nr:Hsp20/alpha crystallin family protein [Candidatus Bathyarchaeota archaeon]